jgi:hypothetical protein
MDPHDTATRVPDPDAVEFIRFCYGRRRVGWPELYDEMCGVAARGLFRGLVADDLAAFGIGFSLFDMPALATMTAGVVSQEQARRRPMTVVIAADPPTGPADTEARDAGPRHAEPPEIENDLESEQRSESPTRYVSVPVGA